jgi:hypothetical protein
VQGPERVRVFSTRAQCRSRSAEIQTQPMLARRGMQTGAGHLPPEEAIAAPPFQHLMEHPKCTRPSSALKEARAVLAGFY